VAAADSTSTDKSFDRWQLVSRLFSSSALAEYSPKGGEGRSPPSQPQLATCIREIGYLKMLLSSKSFINGLPGSDSVVTNLLKRSFLLQTDSLQLDQSNNKRPSIPILKEGVQGRRLVSTLWKSSRIDFFQPSKISVQTKEPDERTPEVTAVCAELNIASILSPSYDLLGNSVDLLVHWIRRVPRKKARQLRLKKSLQALTKSLQEEATDSDKKHEQTLSERTADFAAAFAANSNVSGHSRKACFLWEAAFTIAILQDVNTIESVRLSWVKEVGNFQFSEASLSSSCLMFQVLSNGHPSLLRQ